MRRSHTRSRFGCSCAAFTLIELLVVVSIIALLISLLLPSLKRARQLAKSVMCLANIKAIAAGSLTYAAEDQHEQSIPVHPLFDQGGDPGAYDWGGKAGRGDSLTGNPIDSPYGTPQGRGPATRPLNAVLFKERFTDYRDIPGLDYSNWKKDQSLELEIYRCPSDRGYSGHHYATWADSRLSSYDHYGTSYAHSTLLFGGPGEMAWSLSPYFRPLSRVPVPAETVYYMENCGRFAWHVRFGIDDEPDRYACARYAGIWALPAQPAHVDGWHGRAYDIASAFIDGHAVMVEMNGRVVPPPGWTSWRTRTSRSAAWNASNAGEGYSGFFAYRSCFWIRGDDWRMDANPAPPGELYVPDWPTPMRAEIR